jgi:glycosyltransferase involved in cell wall biosynthesis
MRIVMFGGFDPDYARNHVLRLGLGRLGVRVDRCAASPRRRWLGRSAQLVWRWARLPRPDAVLVPEFRHKDVPLARLLATLRGAALVVDPLVSRYDTKIDDWGSAGPASLQADHNRRIDRAAVRFADLLLCDTGAHALYFQRRYRVPLERTAIVPVGFDDVVFQPLPPPPPAPFRVAFFGSYLPLHGIETIVEAARRLGRHDVRFLLVGRGQTFPAVAALQRQGVALELVPPLSPVALVERLRASHVLLGIFGTTPKAARVVPNKVYQGMALARAVISADTPALREFFVPEQHLLAVPPGDGAALAAAILRLRADPALREQLARDGCRWVHERYRPEAVARRLLDAGAATLGWTVPG